MSDKDLPPPYWSSRASLRHRHKNHCATTSSISSNVNNGNNKNYWSPPHLIEASSTTPVANRVHRRLRHTNTISGYPIVAASTAVVVSQNRKLPPDQDNLHSGETINMMIASSLGGAAKRARMMRRQQTQVAPEDDAMATPTPSPGRHYHAIASSRLRHHLRKTTNAIGNGDGGELDGPEMSHSVAELHSGVSSAFGTSCSTANQRGARYRASCKTSASSSLAHSLSTTSTASATATANQHESGGVMTQEPEQQPLCNGIDDVTAPSITTTKKLETNALPAEFLVSSLQRNPPENSISTSAAVRQSRGGLVGYASSLHGDAKAHHRAVPHSLRLASRKHHLMRINSGHRIAATVYRCAPTSQQVRTSSSSTLVQPFQIDQPTFSEK